MHIREASDNSKTYAKALEEIYIGTRQCMGTLFL